MLNYRWSYKSYLVFIRLKPINSCVTKWWFTTQANIFTRHFKSSVFFLIRTLATSSIRTLNRVFQIFSTILVAYKPLKNFPLFYIFTIFLLLEEKNSFLAFGVLSYPLSCFSESQILVLFQAWTSTKTLLRRDFTLRIIVGVII